MKIVSLIFQIIVALGLLNVWVLRFHQKTPFRGGEAQTMPQEFAAYKLPVWCLWVVGGLKIVCALCLLAGIWVPALVAPAAGIVSVLMVGAIAMHFKVRDPLIKSLPAGIVLVLLSVILVNAF
jgi:uncharacterized membrane protein YphA (DoxX/SURF4 family)